MPSHSFFAQRYEYIGLAILVGLMSFPPAMTFFAFMDWLKSRLLRTHRRCWILRTALIADLILLLCAVDGWFIEPVLLTVTRVSVASPKIAPGTGSLKIVHISDTHFTTWTPLYRRVIRTVAAENPDLVVFTGDIYQMGWFDETEFGEFMTSLCSIAPLCFSPGYDDENLVIRASGGKAVFVGYKQQPMNIRGTKVRVIGLCDSPANTHNLTSMSPSDLNIAINHTPDLLEYVEQLGADWYFAGHTHGGQVRLPFWGAVITNCATGKKYEYGHYRRGRMEAFVTRGIGLEPRPAPQVRFLCPPEVVVITIK